MVPSRPLPVMTTREMRSLVKAVPWWL